MHFTHTKKINITLWANNHANARKKHKSFFEHMYRNITLFQDMVKVIFLPVHESEPT
jgi:hypothetical protein